MREFILLGLSSDWDTQVALSLLFSITYVVTVLGNVLIVLVIRLDSRLHTPMYVFLTNLSLVDASYATSIVPQMLVHLIAEHKGIPCVSCAAQLFFSLGLGGIEFVLLAVMAYDRYVAVCDPLRYLVIVHGGLCARLAITSWVSASVNSLMQTTITFQLPMCMNKYIDHISCELLAVVRLACVDTSSNEIAIMVSSYCSADDTFLLGSLVLHPDHLRHPKDPVHRGEEESLPHLCLSPRSSCTVLWHGQFSLTSSPVPAPLSFRRS
ncbi:Olfactory receptor-like protein OLF3, partial [Eschrichtius robustus]|nr:Olfactory receptor-like protein OLF3 [Eschrichtius robustus]